ncbi:MAG: hypothetical protein K0U93_10470, partial [Gammaproteobacteria bacterium]|nr:hypothetical protein [Gammaproteobacteria bacterium]
VEVRVRCAYVGIDYFEFAGLGIRNSRNMTGLGRWDLRRCRVPSNISFNSPGHINQVHLIMDENKALLSAGDTEMAVLDVSNPDRQRGIGGHGSPKNGLGV